MLNRKYLIFYFLGFLLIGAVLVYAAVFTKAQAGLLLVDFFDVGQGKAIFIETPDKHQILIDGGPDNSVLEKLSGVMPFFDREIDLVILTHPDSDHLSGLIDVLERYKVDGIIETGIFDSSAIYKKWQSLIKEKNIPVIYASAGEKIKIGDSFLLLTLFPVQNISGKSFENTNSTSIVSRLIYGKISFLFTGDAEAATESYLVASNVYIDSDILDVGHHGSKNSSSQGFLEAVTPQTAVIQVGAKNRYGHPAPETLQRLDEVKTKIYRTDLCEDVKILSDGKNYQIESGCE